METPKLIDDRMPDNQLTDSKKWTLWDWIHLHFEEFEEARDSYATIAAKATQTLRFRVTPKNIEGSYKTLEIPAPCRRRENKPVEDVKAMLRIIANEVARNCRQQPSHEFIVNVLRPLGLDAVESEAKEFKR